MNIFYTLMLIGEIIAIIKLYKWLNHRNSHKNDRYYSNMYESIHKLNERVQQIEELENMITDIEACSNNLLKSIRIELPDSLATMRSGTHFLINGKDENSKYLLSIAYSERERLRTSLTTDLEQILRSGITKTVTETNKIEEGGVQHNG